MQKLYKILAFIISVLFCSKTFFTAFYSLSIHPRDDWLLSQESEYSHPSTYLWVECTMNIFALLSGFWLFAGLYENLFSYFSPALAGVVLFLTIDLLLHSVLLCIANKFHAVMIFNLCTSALFAPCMYIVYKTCKDFDDLNPQQIVHRDTHPSVRHESDQTNA